MLRPATAKAIYRIVERGHRNGFTVLIGIYRTAERGGRNLSHIHGDVSAPKMRLSCSLLWPMVSDFNIDDCKPIILKGSHEGGCTLGLPLATKTYQETTFLIVKLF